MEEIRERVRHIDLILASHGEKLQKMEAWGDHLKSIADNAQGMARNIQVLTEGLLKAQSENAEMVGILAGKKQVPISVFSWIVGALLLILIVLEIRLANMDMDLSPSGLKLKQVIEQKAEKTQQLVEQGQSETEQRLHALEEAIKRTDGNR